MKHPRDHDKYMRSLELIALLAEDLGKIIQHTNDYFNKGMNKKDLEEAQKELTKIQSPLNEMAGLLEVELRRKGESDG